MPRPKSELPKQNTSIIFGVSIGIVSAALFSLTFVLNSAISQSNGPWIWTAVLRYFMTVPLVLFALTFFLGLQNIILIFRGFLHRAFFWIFAGSLSCGLFYSGIVYAANYMPGWIVAATWQTTIVASVVIVFLFSKAFSFMRLCTSLVVLLGVFLVNWQVSHTSIRPPPLAFLSIFASAISYPIGNQLLNIERQRTLNAHEPIGPVLQNPFVGVLMLAIGSLPFWIVLLVLGKPDNLVSGQLTNIFLTTVFAGIFATALFYYARNLTTNPNNITAVDTTQSTEVIFALFLEIILISAALPNQTQIIGMFLIILGVAANCLIFNKRKN